MPVCVSGMHRSGTSMVAKVLMDGGLYLGPGDDMMPPAPGNPEGFWENLRFVGVNDALLAQLGGAWDLPPDPPADWNDPDLAEIHQAAVEIVGSFAGNEPWGWKDPRNCLTIPFWRSVTGPLRHVFVVRNPLEVARSLLNRNGFSPALSLSIWRQYTSRFLADTRREDRVITHFDAYFGDPEPEVRRLLAFAELPHDEETVARAATNASPGLKHHRLTISDLLEANVAPGVINLYLDLCEEAGFGETLGIPGRLPLRGSDRPPPFRPASPETAVGGFGLWLFAQQRRTRELEMANAVQELARNELEGRIHERDGMVLEREARVAERDGRIADRDAQIAEREARIGDRDAQIAERDARIAERDARIAERDARIAERDARIAERDARIAERNRTITRLTREIAVLRQTVEDQDLQLEGLTDQAETLTRHESELREMLAASQDQLLSHDTEIMGTLGGALARVVPGAPAATYYRQVLDKVRSLVRANLPAASTALVATYGDDEFLELGVRQALPFPRADGGVTTDYTSVDSDTAISQLEALRARGAGYLVVPSPAQAWLGRLPALGKHLEQHYPAIVDEPGTCTIYALGETTAA